jgi:hypothetical protein
MSGVSRARSKSAYGVLRTSLLWSSERVTAATLDDAAPAAAHRHRLKLAVSLHNLYAFLKRHNHANGHTGATLSELCRLQLRCHKLLLMDATFLQDQKSGSPYGRVTRTRDQKFDLCALNFLARSAKEMADPAVGLGSAAVGVSRSAPQKAFIPGRR